MNRSTGKAATGVSRLSRKSVSVLVFGLAMIVSTLLPPQRVQAQVDLPHSAPGSIVLSNGKKLAYSVEMGRIPIRDGASNDVRAYMFFVAYRVPSKSPRPISFLWNGGPGSPSAILHLQSVGPRRMEADGSIIDFPDTALAATDLVFVDAPGTGFSRIARPEFAKDFYQTRGDVAAFTDFVRAWRLLYKTEDAPLYLVGESWGGFRAAAVAHALELRNIRVSGIVDISGRTGLPGSLPDTTLRALYVVQRAVIARHFDKLDPTLPTDISALQDEVRDWTLATYVPALNNLAVLSFDQREEIAAQLARFTGLDVRDINRKTLIVTPAQFLGGLLKDKGETLDTFDMTKTTDTAPAENPQAVERYLRKELGYVTDLAYINWTELSGFAPDGGVIKSPNATWDYLPGYFLDALRADEIATRNEQLIAEGEPPRGQDTPEAAEAMAINPDLRMLIAEGLYDSLSSCASSREIIARQTPAIAQRIALHCYPSGHMVYSEPQTRLAFSRDFKAFVNGHTSP